MVKRINLALQGGGAHGAFSWGVIDRLLQEDEIEIAAISGTSAGALNGAALKAGLASAPGPEGRAAARRNLDHVWSRIGKVSNSLMSRWLSSMIPAPHFMQRLTHAMSPLTWFETMGRFVSPYDFGVLYRNPLASIIAGMPHAALNGAGGPQLFVSATNVRTGRIRIFANGEVTPETIMTSACLPTVFKAVEITDPRTGRTEAYWDGGYSGNPALFPLYDPALPRDIVIVNINPMIKDGVPRLPAEIEDRINEISFNAALLGELRAIRFVKRLFDEDRLSGRAMKNVLVHMIRNDDLMAGLAGSSKIVPGPGLVAELHAAGREAAQEFIDRDLENVGHRDSCDVAGMLAWDAE